MYFFILKFTCIVTVGETWLEAAILGSKTQSLQTTSLEIFSLSVGASLQVVCTGRNAVQSNNILYSFCCFYLHKTSILSKNAVMSSWHWRCLMLRGLYTLVYYRALQYNYQYLVVSRYF